MKKLKSNQIANINWMQQTYYIFNFFPEYDVCNSCDNDF